MPTRCYTWEMRRPSRRNTAFSAFSSLCRRHRTLGRIPQKESGEHNEDSLHNARLQQRGAVSCSGLGPGGRCNWNGRLEAGTLHVFLPHDEEYPAGVYKQATTLTSALMNREHGVSIDDSSGFAEYFRHLYSIANLEAHDLMEAIKTKHFPLVRKHYRVIEQDSVNVLVAYDRDCYDKLVDEARSKGLSRDWVMRASPHTVSCFLLDLGRAPVEPVRLRDKERTPSGDWFLYLRSEHYDHNTGLNLPNEQDYLEE